jgi:DNA-binding protein HU-beta
MSDKAEKASDKFFKRQDLLAAVVEKTGLPRPKAIAVLESVFDTITERLTAGQEVRLMGFGAFVVTERKGGKGRDPRTGAEIDVPDSKSVRFRAGKGLRDAVGGKTAAATE